MELIKIYMTTTWFESFLIVIGIVGIVVVLGMVLSCCEDEWRKESRNS